MRWSIKEKLASFLPYLNRQGKFFALKRLTLILLMFFGVVLLLAWAEPVFATSIAEDVYSGFMRLISWVFLTLAKVCIGLAIFGLRFFIEIAQYNGYIDAPTVMVGWALVRDVANMFFVVVLLLIAFGTILGLENYQWNKTLIKFILAAVFINFSNLICGLFIDFAHVFTITFVNAIASTAGGNLINMFHVDAILSVVRKTPTADDTSIDLDVLAGSFTAFLFAVMLAGTILAYLVVMVARLVVLWVLIILSPLAFILQVIPQTQSYAGEWWKKFGNQVMVAPVMVFFLWLSFATVGSGDIATTLPNGDGKVGIAPAISTEAQALATEGQGTSEMSLSLSKVSTWENMSNFLIAMALLLVGLGVVQQLGVVGGSMAGKVMDFGKKVATIASGYAAGRWLVGSAAKGLADASKKGVKHFAMNMPLGGHTWTRLGKKIQQARTYSPILRHIPIIGNYKEVYNEKMNARVDKTEKMRREAMLKDTTKIGMPLTERIGNIVPNLAAKGIAKGLKKIGSEETLEYLGIEHWEEKGMAGLDAATARRNAAEEDYKSSMDLRGPTNKKIREASNEASLRVEGIELLINTRNEHLDKWAEENGHTREEVLEDEQLWKDFNDSDEGEELKQDYKDINVTDNKIVPVGRKERLRRNAAKFVLQEERLHNLDADLEKAKSQSREAYLDLQESEQGLEDRAIATMQAKTGEERIKALTAGHTASAWGEAEEKLYEAQQIDAELPEEDKHAVKDLIDDGSNNYDPIVHALHAESEARTKEQEEKQARSLADKALAKTDMGKELVEQLASAEIGEKMGKDFIDEIKDTKVKAEFEEARAKLDAADGQQGLNNLINPENEDGSVNESYDKFAAAIHAMENRAAAEKEKKGAEDSAIKAHGDAEEKIRVDLHKRYKDEEDEEIKERPETAQSRLAEAETQSQAVKNYLEILTKKDERYEDAADDLKNYRERIEEADTEEEKEQIREDRTEYLNSNPYAADVYYEQLKAEDAARETEKKHRVEEEFFYTNEGAKNISEQIRIQLHDVADHALEKLKSKESSEVLEKARTNLHNGVIDVDDPIIHAMVLKAQKGEEEDVQKLADSLLYHDARGQFVDMKNRNYKTSTPVLIDIMEKRAQELKQEDEFGRGHAVARVTQLIAGLRKLQAEGKGDGPDAQNKMAAIYTLVSANENKNLDDGLTSIVNAMNLLERYKRYKKLDDEHGTNYVEKNFSVGEREQIESETEEMEALYEVARDEGWVHKSMTKEAWKNRDQMKVKIKEEWSNAGKKFEEKDVDQEWKRQAYAWDDTNSAWATSNLQTYLLTGGDKDYIDEQYGALDYMEKNGIKEFSNGAKEYFQKVSGQDEATAAASTEALISKNEGYQEIFKSVMERFKMDGLKGGHWQLAGNLMLDENLHMVRPSTPSERNAIVKGTAVKIKDIASNPQKNGPYSNTRGHQNEISESEIEAAEHPQVNTTPGVERMTNRERRIILDSHKNTKGVPDDEGYATLSDSKDYVEARGGGDYALGLLDRIVSVHMSQIRKGGISTGLVTAVENGLNVTRFEAEAGIMKGKLAGLEDYLSTDEGKQTFQVMVQGIEDPKARKRAEIIIGKGGKINDLGDFADLIQLTLSNDVKYIEAERAGASKEDLDSLREKTVIKKLEDQIRKEEDDIIRENLQKQLGFLKKQITAEKLESLDNIALALHEKADSYRNMTPEERKKRREQEKRTDQSDQPD